MQRTEAEVERLVRENHKLVQYQVSRYLKRCAVQGMERDDLVSWGLMGLAQAARMWDPERGAFSTVACRAIEWMLRRGVGRECRSSRAVILVSLDELLARDEPGDRPERFLDRLEADQHVERDLLESATEAAIQSAVAALPPSERRLIQRHFFEGVPITRVAVELGVSRQSLGERQRKALRKLRTILDASIAAVHS
ncbi:MAG TPA: sigma-70 family RNA polymerase sigma factor [Armatimonadota bacterium]|nr:sigma-70 family RNA polymerase sigma factor [Armatimonadota bacterium]